MIFRDKYGCCACAAKPTTPEQLDEYRARHLCEINGDDPDALDRLVICDKENNPLPQWQAYLEGAIALRAADEALGIPTEALLALIRGEAVVVPVKLTDAMVAAATEALNAPRMCVGSVKHQKVNDLHVGHRAMLAASPYAKQVEK